MADKTQKQMDTERIIAAKLRENCMAIYKGLAALENIPRFQSQFASLGCEAYDGNTEECYENLPDGAIALSCGDVYNAKQSLDRIAGIMAAAVANIDNADLAMVEQINIRE